MSNPWKKSADSAIVQNLSDIMSEELARGLQAKETVKFAELLSEQIVTGEDGAGAVPPELLRQLEQEKCDSDSIIAQLLQCQYDKEHDEQINRVEKKRNGSSKVSVSYDNFRYVPNNLVYDTKSDEDVNATDEHDWDRFETNEKEFATLPKCGYKVVEGEMITKHDSVINGRRNACRVMAFPPEFATGDGAGFDMKLPNAVFNSLKAHSRSDQARRHKMLDRKESQATAVLGVDEKTKLILFKLINNGMLERINGVISTGKESVVLHADSDLSFPDTVMPKECAIKVFKTTMNEFKTRDKYIESDYRFKDRFTKQNPRKVVHMWAEKEMHNMMRMQKIGMNCPHMICLKKHILVMSFIGKESKPAPKLKDLILKDEEWASVYREVVDAVCKLYNVGHLIHADLSEYNILWHENKCWLIDVSQSVEPDHPHGLEFLLRDCRNISRFFQRKGVDGVKCGDDLFKQVTGVEVKELDVKLLEGVRSGANAASQLFEVNPGDSRNVNYPFEYVWQKTCNKEEVSCVQNSDDLPEVDEFNEMWQHSQNIKIDQAANFANELKLEDEAKKD